MARYFISDTHFGHFNVIKTANRPFLHEIYGYRILFNNNTVERYSFSNDKAIEFFSKQEFDITNTSRNEFLELRAKFLSTKMMDETIIKNWNNTVTNEDTVYFLGDFSLSSLAKTKEIFERLNGNKILIKGNHDPSNKKLNDIGFTEIYNSHEIDIKDKKFILNHYPYINPILNDIKGSKRVDVRTHPKGKIIESFPNDIRYNEYADFILDNWNLVFNSKDETTISYVKKLRKIYNKIAKHRLVNKGYWLLHGHTHSSEIKKDNMINVSVEAIDYIPIHEDEIYKLAKDIEYKDISQYLQNFVKHSPYDSSSQFKCFKFMMHVGNCIDSNSHLTDIPIGTPKKAIDYACEKGCFISKKDLEDMSFYKGNCRNADYAIWLQSKNKFVYVRTKFGTKFLEDIPHPIDDEGFDVFIPYKKENPPLDYVKSFRELSKG